jgi:putative glutamine amidotransferase
MDEKVAEVISHSTYKNVFGVQFHPEKSALYDVDSQPIKWFPEDSVRNTYYTFLEENNSLRFHKRLWEKIGELYQTN